MKLVKVTIKTANGLIVECEVTPKTIEELIIVNQVSVKRRG